FEHQLEHKRLEPALNRLVFGLLTSALFLGSALLWSLRAPPLAGDVSLPGLAGCCLRVVLGRRLAGAVGEGWPLGRWGGPALGGLARRTRTQASPGALPPTAATAVRETTAASATNPATYRAVEARAPGRARAARPPAAPHPDSGTPPNAGPSPADSGTPVLPRERPRFVRTQPGSAGPGRR